MDAASGAVQGGEQVKKIIAIIIIMVLVGCSAKEKPSEPPSKPKLGKDASRFVTVEGGSLSLWQIVADRETGVMYAVSKGSYNGGTFTLLVDAEGKPMIWEGVRSD